MDRPKLLSDVQAKVATRRRQRRCPVPPLAEQHQFVADLDALQAQLNALKRLQAETAAELDALLPAILESCPEPADSGLGVRGESIKR
jgi:hypothetical protein